MTRVSQAQMKKLLDLLSKDGVMLHGKVIYTNTNRQSFWKKIATQLNLIKDGAFKNAYKWCKMWADWKNKTKRKADVLLKRRKCEFMPQPLALTNLELRLLRIISYPLEDNIDVQLEMTHKVEIPDHDTNDINIDFLSEDSNEPPPCKQQVITDEEDNKAHKYFFRSKPKHINRQDGIDDKSELLDELSNVGKRAKLDEKCVKHVDLPDEFKIRTKLALEEQKSKQRNEELRLKALELKLKGEELRLKEVEMNKVNYLTTIEEEKLKCFRDILSCLRELVEKTRNGNMRFNNVL